MKLSISIQCKAFVWQCMNRGTTIVMCLSSYIGRGESRVRNDLGNALAVVNCPY